MAEMNCDICGQPAENRGRSQRKTRSFPIVVNNDYLNGVNVPCSFKQRLNQYVPGKWLVARTTGFRKFDLYLEKVLINGVEKEAVAQTVVKDVPSTIRSILHRTIFTDIHSITKQDMGVILFGIFKDVFVEHEFYELMDQKNFWVHKVDGDNIYHEALYMPSVAVDGYKYPGHGIAHIYREGQVLGEQEEEFIDCTYSIQWDLEHVCFQNGWDDFTGATGIVEGSLLLVKVDPMKEYIGLNFVEISN